jgi:hypothetical protein
MQMHQADMARRGDWLGNAPSSAAGTAWPGAAPGGHFRLHMPADRKRTLMRGKRKSRVDLVRPAKKLCVSLSSRSGSTGRS